MRAEAEVVMNGSQAGEREGFYGKEDAVVYPVELPVGLSEILTAEQTERQTDRQGDRQAAGHARRSLGL